MQDPRRTRSPARLVRTVLVPHGLSVGAAAIVAWFALGEVVAVCNGPAVPLDDTYIHFQYARALAELHPFRYTAGAEPTPGATSLLWPALLAPFHAVGLRGARLIWAAWALGFLSLGLTAVETARLAGGLVSRGAAIVAGAMVFAFGGFVWFAGSGMEVIPFAWLLTRTTRRSAEWLELDEDGPHVRELLALSIASPLMRPEGALATLTVFAVLLARPGGSRARALPALLGLVAPSLVCFVATGQPVMSTALAKWLPINPYYPLPRLIAAVTHNVGLFFGTLLDGRLWTSLFLPEGGWFAFVLALVAVPVVGFRQRKLPRALLVLVLAFGALMPTTYETFLVNRVRYIWPFFTGHLVALAALAEILGFALAAPVARLGVRPSHAAGAVAMGFLGLLAERVPPSVSDLASSSEAISLQQVALARWASEALPASARLGVNDTGALAYFSGRPTFDVVGLTTAGEARYWTGGTGSRFEHYEHLSRDRLPTHFVVYPEWFGIEALLGDALAQRTVHHTILGGATMSAHEARYDLLGSGEEPADPVLRQRRLVDSLDVADLESESAHDYELLDATKEENLVLSTSVRADGGRSDRTLDRFRLKIAPGGSLVARWSARSEAPLSVRVDGRTLGAARVGLDYWQEVRFEIPGDVSRGSHRIEVTAESTPFYALHYWSYE